MYAARCPHVACSTLFVAPWGVAGTCGRTASTTMMRGMCGTRVRRLMASHLIRCAVVQRAACNRNHALCNMQRTACNIHYATCNMQQTPYGLRHSTYDIYHHMQLQHATATRNRHMQQQHATCKIDGMQYTAQTTCNIQFRTCNMRIGWCKARSWCGTATRRQAWLRIVWVDDCGRPGCCTLLVRPTCDRCTLIWRAHVPRRSRAIAL